MKKIMARLLPGLAVSAALAVVVPMSAANAAGTDDFPSGVIRIISPAAAGGGTDLISRILARAMSKYLNSSVIVQDMPGAGATLGERYVADAKPDGYTLLLHHVGLATAPALYKDLPFDPVKSFEPIGLFADTPLIIVSSKNLPPNNLKELFDYVRHADNPVTMASSGEGSATYLCALLFQQAVGKPVTMVPYGGDAPALIDLQGERVDLLCDVTAGVASYVKSKRVKAFVLTGDKRLASLPDLPTSAEAGFDQLTMSAWYGLFAPAHTPKPVIERLEKALQAADRDPAVAKELAALETVVFDPSQATPAALHARLVSQMGLWTPIIRKAKSGAGQ